MSCPIFIDPLPRDLTSAELAELVRPFGRVLSAKVTCDSLGQSLRFGRVQMETEEETDTVCKRLHGTVFHNATLTVLRMDEIKTAAVGRSL
jgi:RNA recognition motif-containing protein